jgi:histidinol dehydrogenase
MTSANTNLLLQAKPLVLRTTAPDFEASLTRRLAWESSTDHEIEQTVSDILSQVQIQGDAAVLAYTQRFDRVQASSVAELEISQDVLKAAFDKLPEAQRLALLRAADRVRVYHEAQKRHCGESWQYREADGTVLGQKVTPLDRVGIYVPGGKAAYPSSVLMNAVPAKVAGVAEIIMVVPTPGGERNPMVMAAAYVAGVNRVFAIGGAQAVAALAYGTATIPAVDKVTGPGNAYVASAKRRVFGKVGIDMIAGPSEILVLADGTTPPDWVAMDLFSQAEHDELAQSILLCPNAAYIDAVQEAIDRLLPQMPRAAIIAKSLNDRGAMVLTRDMQEACAISNRIAPEHLEISSREPHTWEPLLRHAGAIFLGAFTSESLGDYCAGPNHVLPTSSTARFSSPLGVYDFQKRSSLIEVSHAGAQTLGPIAAELAYAEGLQAHARAAEMRVGAPDLQATLLRASNHAALSVIRADLQGMHAYAVQDSRGMVKLDAMENPYELSTALKIALGERLGAIALNRYPGEGFARLQQALMHHAAVPEGYGLVVGNGSDELISLLTIAVDQPGAIVLAPTPGFVMYEMSARLLGLRFVGVHLQDDFELDAPAMVLAIKTHRPALVYLAYPNNPTANAWDDQALEEVVKAVGRCGGLVVIDEAYQPFAARSYADRMQSHSHVLVLRTLSKFGLAGVRIGYLMGPKALTDEIEKVRPPYNISVLNAETALFALEHEAVFKAQAEAIKSDREALLSALSGLPRLKVYPSQANMILTRVLPTDNTIPQGAATGTQWADLVFASLKEKGILVKNVSKMHPLLHDCLRLTVGTPLENEKMIAALKASL